MKPSRRHRIVLAAELGSFRSIYELFVNGFLDDFGYEFGPPEQYYEAVFAARDRETFDHGDFLGPCDDATDSHALVREAGRISVCESVTDPAGHLRGMPLPSRPDV